MLTPFLRLLPSSPCPPALSPSACSSFGKPGEQAPALSQGGLAITSAGANRLAEQGPVSHGGPATAPSAPRSLFHSLLPACISLLLSVSSQSRPGRGWSGGGGGPGILKPSMTMLAQPGRVACLKFQHSGGRRIAVSSKPA